MKQDAEIKVYGKEYKGLLDNIHIVDELETYHEDCEQCSKGMSGITLLFLLVVGALTFSGLIYIFNWLLS